MVISNTHLLRSFCHCLIMLLENDLWFHFILWYFSCSIWLNHSRLLSQYIYIDGTWRNIDFTPSPIHLLWTLYSVPVTRQILGERFCREQWQQPSEQMCIVFISYGGDDKGEFKQKAGLFWLKRAGWHKEKHMMVKLSLFQSIYCH